MIFLLYLLDIVYASTEPVSDVTTTIGGCGCESSSGAVIGGVVGGIGVAVILILVAIIIVLVVLLTVKGTTD